jgi:hypothetical protein
LFAEGDADRRDHPWCFKDEIAGRVADLRLRKTDKRLEELLLCGIEADKARACDADLP